MAFQNIALKGYNRASHWQLVFQMEKLPLFVANLEAAIKLTNSPLNIVDYGCSEGFNSMQFFNKSLELLRKTSQRPVSILHTDLPKNDWSEFFQILNNPHNNYLTNGNVAYSALGRSFYEDIVLPETVHVGFSAFAFHYLSKKPIRKPGDTGIFHSAYIEQGRQDMETLLNKRINELVPGGTLMILVGARTEQLNAKMGRLYFEPLSNLIKMGVISQEDFSTFEMNTYAFTLSEWQTLLKKLENKVKIIELKMEKSICPFYLEYLKDKDIEVYKDELMQFVAQMMKVQVNTFIKRTQEEKDKIIEMLKTEIKSIIHSDPTEVYMEFTTLVLEKLK